MNLHNKLIFLFLSLLISISITSCDSKNDVSNDDLCLNNPCKDSLINHKTVCRSLEADFTCVCEDGYVELPDKTCALDNETIICKADTCTEENTVCREYNGSALCVCEDGYSLDNGKCVGVDPCLVNPCTETNKTICGRVTNEEYVCYCDAGYIPTSNDGCTVASYGNYYSTITDDLKDNDLIEALYQKIKGHTSISYTSAGNKLDDIDGHFCSYSGLTNLSLNTEHVWPQSYFGGSSPMVSDLHHLRNAASYVNSKRGNVHFGNVVKTDCNPTCYDNCNYDNNCAEDDSCCYFCDWDGVIYDSGVQTEAKKGKPSNNCNDYPVFEPMDSIKGDVARALFYFAVRYKNDSINESQAYMTGPAPYNHIPPYEEIVLRKWHLQDPVSQEELQRNNKIENIQHNRNPFIDRPDLVNRISDF
jgi:endonuclease I